MEVTNINPPRITTEPRNILVMSKRKTLSENI
jgi:hypothetical protein